MFSKFSLASTKETRSYFRGVSLLLFLRSVELLLLNLQLLKLPLSLVQLEDELGEQVTGALWDQLVNLVFFSSSLF